ncbi:chaperonin 10-like protein [Halteromyces radiatus]|uniref:chaperonin 10-like protein n=1 Tax=Halteromyces radiatus TaxID=101107 RepID=UPI0022203A0A|nr:chaperonin 10-like protein [Halteromyces radiatus]KAI8100066.1 chaperonin 10-like protein [Halteromyces radiatus]
MTLSEMNVARWEKEGSITVTTTLIPKLRPGELLIKVAASGLCGTDMHICHGETPHASKNVVIGHEFSGYVEAIHPDTITTLTLGQLVAIDPNMPCNACTYCRNRKYHLCPNLSCIGVSIHGGMSQYVAVPVRAAVPVPSNVPADVASLAEPLSCVVHAVDLGEIKTGDQVLVIGAGPIGLMTMALCATGGARVTVIEPNEMRRKNALDIFGASAAYAPGDLVPGDTLKGEGFDVVFECVGRAQTMTDALTFAKAGATVVWVGVAKTDATVTVSPFDVYRRELTIRSTYTNPYGMERAVNILADGKIQWKQLISHKFTLEQFDQAWAVFRDGQGMKVCVTP